MALRRLLAAGTPLAVARAQVPWEAAVAHDDECLSAEDAPACALQALQLRASAGKQKQEVESACMPTNQWCGTHGPEHSCCGDANQCLPDGGIYKCKPGHAASGGGGGGGGHHEHWCKQVNEPCGWDFRASLECCGEATCERPAYGGDGTMHCLLAHREPAPQPYPHPYPQPEPYPQPYPQPQPEPSWQAQCAANNEECGGPGVPSKPCCSHRATCQGQWEGATRRCVEGGASGHCVTIGEVCGRPREGANFASCCGSSSCRSPWWDVTGRVAELTCQF